jgi:hypothetical protein
MFMEQNEVSQESLPTETPVVLSDYQVSTKKGLRMRVVGLVGVFVLIILAGVGTGFGLNNIVNGNSLPKSNEVVGAPGTLSSSQIEVGKTYGIEDTKKYPDTSDGIIQKGGMDGEGTHHLIRPGGKSQTVYMTSSTLDLDLFVGHKVQVRGETFSAQKAAWFMDVASVKVAELNAQVPTGSEVAVPAE